MEKQLFDWDGYDIMDEGCYIFYNCKLKVDIGEHKINDEFGSISLNYTDGTLEFYGGEGNEVISTHQLELVVK